MELSHEQYIAAFNALPAPIRSYLIDDEMGHVIQELAKRYSLHVDTAGALAKSSTYMLMGIQNPAQTLGELVLAGIDAETAKKILADLNELVFIPVRERMRKFKEDGEIEEGDSSAAELLTKTDAPKPVEYVPTTPAVVIPPTIERPAPIHQAQPVTPPVAPTPVPVVSSPAIPVTPSPVPAPQPVVAAVPPPAVSVPIPPPVDPAVSAPTATPIQYHPTPESTPHTLQGQPAMRTMATDMQAVKEHRVPEPLFGAPIQHPAELTPVPQVPPPPSQPVAHPQPQELPSVPPAPRTSPPPANLPGAPLIREYSSDPYREPIG